MDFAGERARSVVIDLSHPVDTRTAASRSVIHVEIGMNYVILGLVGRQVADGFWPAALTGRSTEQACNGDNQQRSNDSSFAKFAETIVRNTNRLPIQSAPLRASLRTPQ